MARRYILFNKPYGVLCQFSGEGLTLKRYIPVPGVYAAGRLDRDSEGLVLLTNDGDLQHLLTDPKFSHPRTYWVQVEGTVEEKAMQQLRSGVLIQGYRTRPAKVRKLENDPNLPLRNPPIRFRKNVPTCWLEISLTEGRNRQVRRMTAAVGLPTLRLMRIAIGDLCLNALQPGHWRDLAPQELSALQSALRAGAKPDL